MSFMEESDFPECMEQVNDSINAWLVRLNHRYASKNFKQLQECGVHPGQMPVLMLLFRREGISLREMADMLHIKPPTVTVTVQRLEKAGFVRKQPDEKDQRMSRIYLTEKGKNLEKKLQHLYEQNEQILIKGFSMEEKQQLWKYFSRMLDNLSEE